MIEQLILQVILMIFPITEKIDHFNCKKFIKTQIDMIKDLELFYQMSEHIVK